MSSSPRASKRFKKADPDDGYCECGDDPYCDKCFLDFDEWVLGDEDLCFVAPEERERAKALLRFEDEESSTSSEDDDASVTPEESSNPAEEGNLPSAAPAISQGAVAHMVKSLDEPSLRLLVLQLANADQWVASQLANSYNWTQQQKQRKPPAAYDFDYLSKDAWHALNNRSITRLSGSKQYDAAYGVWEEISSCVDTIQENCSEGVTLRTKQSAIETLRKISKTVLLGEDTVGHEVRKQLQYESCIPDVMLEVLETMTPEERVATGKLTDEKGSLIDKVTWVRDTALGYCLSGMDGLDAVLQMLESGEVAEKDESGAKD